MSEKTIINSNFQVRDFFDVIRDLPDGVYNFDPLRELMGGYLTKKRLSRLAASRVAAIVNAVNLQTGALVLCAQDRYQPALKRWFADRGGQGSDLPVQFLPFQRFRKAMIASASIPGAIDPVRHGSGNRQQLVDGGVIDIAPLRAAIAAGATHILVVLMSPRRSTKEPGRKKNLVEVALRAVDLLTGEITRNDVEVAEQVTGLRVLARLLLDQEASLPGDFKSWLGEAKNRKLVEKLSTRVAVDVEVIQPDRGLGDSLDFDSMVRQGWPGDERPGKRQSIMRARFRHGKDVAAEALKAEGIRSLIRRFS